MTSNQSEETSARQRVATVIVQAISLAFLVASVPWALYHGYHTTSRYRDFNTMIKFAVIHLVHKALGGIYLLVIPVVFLVVMRRVVMEEVRYVLVALWSRLNRARRPRSSEMASSVNDLVIRLSESEEQQCGTEATCAGDVRSS